MCIRDSPQIGIHVCFCIPNFSLRQDEMCIRDRYIGVSLAVQLRMAILQVQIEVIVAVQWK